MADNYRGGNEAQHEGVKSWDPYAHALTVISEPHRMIHDGFMFDASGIVASVANGANLDIIIKMDAGQIGHMLLVEFAMADAPVDIFFYENTVVSADGVPVNVHNHNRVSSIVSAAGIFTGPTVTDVGDLLHSRFIPSPAATGGQAAGTMVSGENAEWILGSPTAEKIYLWRLTNNSGGAIKLSYHLNGYQIGYEN